MEPTETAYATVVHHNITFTIEYECNPISHHDAWRPCGDGVWVYDSKDNTLGRNHIGYSHELPYTYPSYAPEVRWNPEGRFHKVIASDKPLWVWWAQGSRNLKFGDIGVALPELKRNKNI